MPSSQRRWEATNRGSYSVVYEYRDRETVIQSAMVFLTHGDAVMVADALNKAYAAGLSDCV